MDKVISFEEQKRIAELQYDISKLEYLISKPENAPYIYSLEKQIWWCKNVIQKIIGG